MVLILKIEEGCRIEQHKEVRKDYGGDLLRPFIVYRIYLTSTTNTELIQNNLIRWGLLKKGLHQFQKHSSRLRMFTTV